MKIVIGFVLLWIVAVVLSIVIVVLQEGCFEKTAATQLHSLRKEVEGYVRGSEEAGSLRKTAS